jgi:hypothetical protein
MRKEKGKRGEEKKGWEEGERKEERTSISKVYSDTPTVLRRARRTSSVRVSASA